MQSNNVVKPLDVVRAFVKHVVKPKTTPPKPIRRSDKTVRKSAANKNDLGKDVDHPIQLVDEEVTEDTGS